MKYIFITITLVFTFLVCSCDDHIETGIEGRWQMTKIEKTNGDVVKIDTIFYSFKKGVFQYLTLLDETSSNYSMGLYNERNDSLFLVINTHLQNAPNWGEGIYTRDYKIESRSSTKMVLNYQDDVYHFRKY